MRRDIRHAFRLLIRDRLSTLTACVTLALGIGVNAVMFSVVDAAVLRPLPYRDPERLVNIYRIGQSVDGTRVPGIQVRGDLVAIVRSFQHIFEAVEVIR